MTLDKRTISTCMLCSWKLEKKINRNKGTKLLNDLPDDIEQITSPLLFKFRLKCYMLQLLEQ